MVRRFATGLAAFFFLPLAQSSDRFLEEEVHSLISFRERAELLALEDDEERERFIEVFWARRDPTPGTIRNEAREAHERRLGESDLLFREGALSGRHSQRGRIHQLLGSPRFRESFDRSPFVPLELWHFTGVESRFLPDSFYLVFFRPSGDTRYRLYRPAIDGIGALLQDGEPGRGLLGSAQPELARIDPELAAAVESLTPGAASASAELLASLDALPDLLDRDRRETASVRSEASFGTIGARLEAVLLFDDARVSEIHYALELAPGATEDLLASGRKRFTLQGAFLGPSGELDRWEDTLLVETVSDTLAPGNLSFQGRRLAPALADRVEVTLVDDRGESAFASAQLSRLLLVGEVRRLEDFDPELPFRVGDRLLSPVPGGVVSDPAVFAVAHFDESETEIVWEIWNGQTRVWHERGPSVSKPLPLANLQGGAYRLVVRGSRNVLEKEFEWNPVAGRSRALVLARQRSSREEAAYRRARASSFSRRGDDARAASELSLAAAALPADIRLQLELASFRYTSGNHDEVVNQLSSVKGAFHGEVDVLVLLGASLEALGRIDEAAAIYEEAVALAPENAKVKESHERLREKASVRAPRRDR